jgi:signal transduction histidine kinase
MRPLAERTASLLRPPSVKGRDWQRHAHLYLLRLTLALCAVLLPAFGVLYKAADPAAVDPLWVRFGIGAGSLGLFALTFAVAWLRRAAAGLLFLTACGLAAWFAGVAYANAFAADYAVGLFCTWTVTVMIVSLTSDGLRGLSGYILCSIPVAVGLVLLHPAPGVDAALYFAFMLTAAAVVYVAVSARVGVLEALREREGLLAEAQRTAGLGNWEVDDGGRVLWSDEMYRIVGLDPSAPPSFEAFAGRVHFDDRAALFGFFDALRAGRRPGDPTLRLLTDEGETRVIRLRGAAERTRGRPARLHGVAFDVTAEAERARALLDAKEHAEAAREEADRAREEAEQARRRAEELARLKGAFLENMSHEIRTPLSAVIGYAQVLSEEVDDRLRPLVCPIEESAQRLLATLNAVPDLARLRADDVPVDLRAVDVAEEVHDAADVFRPAAHEKGLALVVAGPVCGVVARTDRAALRRVLAHLLSNAVKFTDAGRVTLSIEAVGAQVHVRVRDTGRGMAPSFLASLFEEFRQESTGDARSHEGSGLGLALTKGLVDLMGGTVAVESTVGVGSAFTVTLPRAPEPAGEPAARAVPEYAVRA